MQGDVARASVDLHASLAGADSPLPFMLPGWALADDGDRGVNIAGPASRGELITGCETEHAARHRLNSREDPKSLSRGAAIDSDVARNRLQAQVSGDAGHGDVPTPGRHGDVVAGIFDPDVDRGGVDADFKRVVTCTGPSMFFSFTFPLSALT